MRPILRAPILRHIAAVITGRTHTSHLAPFGSPSSTVFSSTSGFYTAQNLLKNIPNAQVDLYDRLPVPYGLARFGVAPDHQDVKNVINKFDAVAHDPRCRFVGNVNVGSDISIHDLQSHYHVVVLAYGASEDRRMGLSMEDDPRIKPGGVMSARAFVGWYNGHPDHAREPVDLTTTDTAVVVGHGNVALDIARVLLSPIDLLAKTDITEHALEELKKSRIRRVHVVGRRGPLQVSFTAKELREMMKLRNVEFVVDQSLLKHHIEEAQAILSRERPRKRLMDILLQGSKTATRDMATMNSSSKDSGKSWWLHFLKSPKELITKDVEQDTKVLTGIKLEKNRLTGSIEHPRAVGTGEFEVIETGLVLRSIGYRSVSISGVPFDQNRGIVPNVDGRVVATDPNTSAECEGEKPQTIEGLYVAGWLKRGPTGVIVSTMYDANQTAEAIITDLKQAPPIDARVGFTDESSGHEGIKGLLVKKGVPVVSFKDWKTIEEYEVEVGKSRGKPREKVVLMEDMLRIARQNPTRNTPKQ
ncbi:hypothetical protein HK102_007177 [Quaeritorhiza haematococci]|nr:hypothetical protein HK102_007177 [Quaeritorhiza haematococci]